MKLKTIAAFATLQLFNFSTVQQASAALDASLIDKGGTSIFSGSEDVAALVEEVRELNLKYAALTSAVAFIEKKCETDSAWRKAYHQGEAAQTVATNEFGIAYRLTIYNDGFVFADNPRVVPNPKDPEAAAKSEAERKALIAAKVEEARQAMERAVLPSKVAEILAARRAAAQVKEVTIVTSPQSATNDLQTNQTND